MLHAISHFFGIDTQSSHMYDFWSGVATQATLILAAIGAYRHHNCHRRGCLRLGHLDQKKHRVVCRKHHK